MYFNKSMLFTEWRVDLLKPPLILVGAIVFLAVSKLFFTFDASISDYDLLIFGGVCNAILGSFPLQRLVSFNQNNQETMLYVNAERKEHRINMASKATKRAKVVNALLLLVSVIFSAALFTHFYNADILGVNGRMVLVALIQQIALPAQVSIPELLLIVLKLWLVIQALSLTTSLRFYKTRVHGTGTTFYGTEVPR